VAGGVRGAHDTPDHGRPAAAALAPGAPANAALTGVGPVVPAHGFPDWYRDASGLRLTLCVQQDDQACTTPAPDPGPGTVSSDPAARSAVGYARHP
jgi:hypothetical protein